MVKLQLARYYHAFTMLETLLVLSLMSLFTLLSVSARNNSHYMNIQSESKAKQLASQIVYLKSKAIKDQNSITLLFNRGSNEVKVVESRKNIVSIKLNNGIIKYNYNMDIVNIDKDGQLNRFGSVYIKFDQTLFRFIFHIEKGSLRIEKQKV